MLEVLGLGEIDRDAFRGKAIEDPDTVSLSPCFRQYLLDETAFANEPCDGLFFSCACPALQETLHRTRLLLSKLKPHLRPLRRLCSVSQLLFQTENLFVPVILASPQSGGILSYARHVHACFLTEHVRGD